MRIGAILRAGLRAVALVPAAVPILFVAGLIGVAAPIPSAAQAAGKAQAKTPAKSQVQATSRQTAAAFVPGIEDLPLMPGLRPVEPASTYFDSPAGRIVIAYAGGPLERPAILAFYATTLPQLGWTPASSNDYRRDGETLRIEIGEARPPLVRFTLSPQ
jgi:hypothetical protein